MKQRLLQKTLNPHPFFSSVNFILHEIVHYSCSKKIELGNRTATQKDAVALYSVINEAVQKHCMK